VHVEDSNRHVFKLIWIKGCLKLFFDHPNCAINSEYSIPPPLLALPYRNNPTQLKEKNP